MREVAERLGRRRRTFIGEVVQNDVAKRAVRMEVISLLVECTGARLIVAEGLVMIKAVILLPVIPITLRKKLARSPLSSP